MTRAMLDEARHAPLDDAGRSRLIEVHERTIEEMEEVLTDELRQELQDIFLPLSGDGATDSEIRIAQFVHELDGCVGDIQPHQVGCIPQLYLIVVDIEVLPTLGGT